MERYTEGVGGEAKRFTVTERDAGATIPVEEQTRPRFQDEGEALDHMRAKQRGEEFPDATDRAIERAERPTFETTEAAAEELLNRRQERIEAPQREAEEAAQKQRERNAEIMNNANVARQHAEAIQATLPQFENQVRDFAHRAAALATVTDPGQRKSQEITLRAEAEQLEQQRERIIESGYASEFNRMVSLRPALADADTRQQLSEWAEKEKGYSRAQIENASTQDIISGYDEWKAGRKARSKEEKQRQAEAAKQITDADLRRVTTRTGVDKPRSSAEALANLKRSGRPDDALNVISLRNVERAKALL